MSYITSVDQYLLLRLTDRGTLQMQFQSYLPRIGMSDKFRNQSVDETDNQTAISPSMRKQSVSFPIKFTQLLTIKTLTTI
ncbi:hypothetical protein CEXT_11021 [Caerostris extrusa]|uniref:Uncharacterized protein n=1 Tax=Caerostris extrusa TaxID=172846 RepID=A0AAV4MCI8_CAEEX|nr:hypothetical protein CEXT_11021 [Caerostris extrusa]